MGMNDPAIQIIEKPDWVSWDDIHEVIWKAHGTNREKGMNMAHAALSGEEIEEHFARGGKMFVAVLENKVIGTAAYTLKKASFWFGEGMFAYCCFAAVLPEYRGRGIYGELLELREKAAAAQGLDKMLFNTHPGNARVIGVASKNGYKKVSFARGSDSPWVFMVKWLNGAPYSDLRMKTMYCCVKAVRLAEYQLRRVFKQ